MQNAYIVTGTVRDRQTITLDEALPADAIRVRLVIEVLPQKPKVSIEEFEKELRERQRQRGHVPRTREEIDAYLQAERDSWGD
jgi:hypothetical protein